MLTEMARRNDDRYRYPITPEWRAAVRRELGKLPRGAMTRLAEAIGASTGQLTEMLSDDSAYSRYVGAVNKYFGWPEPAPPMASSDDEESAALVAALGPDGLDMMRALKAMPKEERQAHMRLIILSARRISD